MSYKIGSFNLLRFSLSEGKKRDDKLASKHFARIIRKENFDIVALQEIDTREALLCLLNELGQNYLGIHSKDLGLIINSACAPAQEFAFVWKKDRVRRIDDPKFYTRIYEKISQSWDSYINLRSNQVMDDPDSVDEEMMEAASGNALFLESSKPESQLDSLRNIMRSLIRPPMVCGFRPSGGWKLLRWELRIINTHIIFGKTRQNRMDEISHIKGKIHTVVNTTRFGDFRSVYTVIAGDYNLETTSLSSLEKNPQFVNDCENHKMISVQEQPTTLRQVSKGNHALTEDKWYSKNYDHYSYDLIRVSPLMKNTKRVGCDDHKTYRQEISDHVPISAEFNP